MNTPSWIIVVISCALAALFVVVGLAETFCKAELITTSRDEQDSHEGDETLVPAYVRKQATREAMRGALCWQDEWELYEAEDEALVEDVEQFLREERGVR